MIVINSKQEIVYIYILRGDTEEIQKGCCKMSRVKVRLLSQWLFCWIEALSLDVGCDHVG